MPEKKRGFWKIFKVMLVLLLIIGAVTAWVGYQAFMGASVTDSQEYLYVKTGDTYDDVLRTISEQNIVKNPKAFAYIAEAMEYPQHLKPGRYKLVQGMSNRNLVNKLRGGHQEAVTFRFENLRLKENLAATLGEHFEADSAAFIAILNNEDVAESYGFTAESFLTMFIPNTYEIYWNTAPDKIVARLHDEYDKFWTDERKAKADSVHLTPQEVSILAAIVKGEALHTDEMPAIAGLYLNRLQRGMLLQADPTVIFANNDFSIRRVLNRHLTVDNPYNTYRYPGLPPGPIMLPSIASIDAVLNHQQHDYIYMCAKDDFSGYHNFAKTQAEHLVNARKFQQALNERNIMR